MKVLQVVADGAPGGGTNHVLQILRGMPKNIECGLVTQQGSYLFDQARKLGVHVVGLAVDATEDRPALGTDRVERRPLGRDLLARHLGQDRRRGQVLARHHARIRLHTPIIST